MLDRVSRFFLQLFSNADVNRVLFFVGGIGVVLYFFFDALTPILLAILLAYVLDSAVAFVLRHSRISRTAAVSLVICLTVLGLLLAFNFIPRWLAELNQLSQQLPQTAGALQSVVDKINTHLPGDFHIEREVIGTQFDAILRAAGEYLLTNTLSLAGNIFNIAIMSILIPLLIFFLLRDRDEVLAYLARFAPRTPALQDLWQQLDEQFGSYVRGKFIEAFIVGFVTWLVFAYFGLKNGFALATLVGVSVFVPFIGAVAVTIPVILFSYLQFGATGTFAALIILYTIVQVLDGQLLVPVLFSEVVRIHPVAIFAAIIFFGNIWGILGVFLAIPLASLVKCIISTIEHYRKIEREPT